MSRLDVQSLKPKLHRDKKILDQRKLFRNSLSMNQAKAFFFPLISFNSLTLSSQDIQLRSNSGEKANASSCRLKFYISEEECALTIDKNIITINTRCE